VAGEWDRVVAGVERLKQNPVVMAGVVVGVLGLWAYLETGWRVRKLRVFWS
jgi:hypothetical protein